MLRLQSLLACSHLTTSPTKETLRLRAMRSNFMDGALPMEIQGYNSPVFYSSISFSLLRLPGIIAIRHATIFVRSAIATMLWHV